MNGVLEGLQKGLPFFGVLGKVNLLVEKGIDREKMFDEAFIEGRGYRIDNVVYGGLVKMKLDEEGGVDIKEVELVNHKFVNVGG